MHDFVEQLEQRAFAAHIARNTTDGRPSTVEWRTRGKGYAISQRVRKRIEQGFGWAKTIGGLSKLPLKGLRRVRDYVTFSFAAHNLIC